MMFSQHSSYVSVEDSVNKYFETIQAIYFQFCLSNEKLSPVLFAEKLTYLISGALATFAFRQRRKVSALPSVSSLTLCLSPTCSFFQPHTHIQ